jgi:mono/diheme cytochrome c family protein
MRQKWLWRSLGLGLLALLTTLAACASSPVTSTSTTSVAMPSFKNNIQPIFNANCVVCHQINLDVNQPQGGLSLEADNAYQNLVNVPSLESPLLRVAPGEPDKSYLVNKLENTQDQVGGSGVQMPYGATPLSRAQIDMIIRWISDGAPDN